jgi:hypothetical protein
LGFFNIRPIRTRDGRCEFGVHDEVTETDSLYDRKFKYTPFDSLVAEIRHCAIRGRGGFLGLVDFDQIAHSRAINHY